MKWNGICNRRKTTGATMAPYPFRRANPLEISHSGVFRIPKRRYADESDLQNVLGPGSLFRDRNFTFAGRRWRNTRASGGRSEQNQLRPQQPSRIRRLVAGRVARRCPPRCAEWQAINQDETRTTERPQKGTRFLRRENQSLRGGLLITKHDASPTVIPRRTMPRHTITFTSGDEERRED